MEYIDILTKEGALTGVSKTKEEVHINGDWHRAVHVWIINSNNEVLMQRRAKIKINHPDMWDISVAGHISAGENSIDSALREIEEEIGISISEQDLEHIGELVAESIQNKGTYINKEYNDVFIVRKDIKLADMQRQISEVDDLRYITLDELKKWIREKNPELVDHEKEFELFFNSI